VASPRLRPVVELVLVIDGAIWGNYSDTTVEVLSAATGALLAQYNVTGMVDGEPAEADGRIYFGTATPTFTGNGKFYALDIPLRAQATATLIIPGPAHPIGYGNTFNGWGIGGSPPDTCHWTFGAMGTSNACGSIPITFNLIGSYPVNFTVTDSVGTTSSYHFNFTYYTGGTCRPGHPCPLWLGAGTTVSSPCSPGSPVFCPTPRTLSFATYVVNGTAPYTYLWNFGDEGTSGANFPDHTYAEDGEYLVTLTVTDHEGLQGSIQFEVDVT
jgi:PKD repeat protein